MQRRIPVFLNPAAGNATEAREALEKTTRFEVRDLDPETLAAELGQVARDGATRVVVAGGDGTIATAAGALAGTSVDLAVLPAGTLNHFAKDHGIPEALTEAVRAAAEAPASRADVGSLNGRVFLNTASVGLYVTFVRLRERIERVLGYHLATAVALVLAFIRFRTFVVELELDGETRHYRTPLVFVGVGERELAAPKFGSRKESGRRGLHVLVVRGHRRARLLSLAMAAASRGTQAAARLPELDSFVVERCTIADRRGRSHITVALDGELLRMDVPLRIEIRRDALSVVSGRWPGTVS